MAEFNVMSKYIVRKRRKNFWWTVIFYCATLISVLLLLVLMLTIINDTFGYVATKYEKDPSDLFASPLQEIKATELHKIFKEHVSKGIYRRYNNEKPIERRTQKDLIQLLEAHVFKKRVEKVWSLYESIFKKNEIKQFMADKPSFALEFRRWLHLKFLLRTQAAEAEITGIRTALLGSLWLVTIAVVFSIPFGVAAAVYLEEYAPRTRVTQTIKINIYNLAGIPSIVYGLLGLAVFVRILEPITQGRTILAGGLTLGLMCLPIIIINSQEAIRAVPNSLRYSSYGIGATKWQTIWHHILPYSFERILTGIILATSRAVGETAPLIVVGAATFISVDPKGIFSRFTALPIQIYQWASRPQAVYQHVAAAAVITLIALILVFNVLIFILRNYFSKQEKL